MEWLDFLKKNVSKTAKGAVKVSNDAFEYTKLKIKLSEINSTIDELYLKIGKGIYNSIKSETESEVDVDSIVTEISALIEQKEEMEQKIMQVTNKKACKYCGASVNAENTYCPNCGEKVQD